MATLIWKKELTEPGIVAEYRTEGGVKVLIHNGAYINATKEERERRKAEAMRVAQQIVNQYCMRIYEETGRVPTLEEIRNAKNDAMPH